MFDTYTIVTGIKEYFRANIVTALAKIGKTDTVKTWKVGWASPYGLPVYDAMLFVPGAFDPNPEEATLILPVDAYIVVQGIDADAVAQKELAYLDAIYDTWEADPSLGGSVFLSEVTDIDYSDPQSGAVVTGVAIATIRAELDTLLGGT